MEKAIPFKLKNRSDINFDMTDEDNKPVCIDSKYLPSDFEEGIRIAGGVYRFVLPGRDVEDLVEDVCYILDGIYNEGGIMSREELRNAFKDGFNQPPVHCATLFKNHGMCKDCPYLTDFISDDNVLPGINTLTPVTNALSFTSDIITVSGREKNREFLKGAERSAGNWVSVEPCTYKGCTSLLLYMPLNRCYFVCPVSLYDSGYRLVAEKIFLNNQITKISSSPFLICMLTGNFSGEYYDARRSPYVEKYGGIKNLVCLSEFFDGGLSFGNEKDFLESLKGRLSGLGMACTGFASRYGLMTNYGKIADFLKERVIGTDGLTEPDAKKNRLNRVLFRMAPVPDGDGYCAGLDNGLLAMPDENGNLTLSPEKELHFSKDFGVYLVSVTKHSDPWSVISDFLLILEELDIYTTLGVRIVGVATDGVKLLYPVTAKQSVYDAVSAAVVKVSLEGDMVTKLKIEDI